MGRGCAAYAREGSRILLCSILSSLCLTGFYAGKDIVSWLKANVNLTSRSQSCDQTIYCIELFCLKGNHRIISHAVLRLIFSPKSLIL